MGPGLWAALVGLRARLRSRGTRLSLCLKRPAGLCGSRVRNVYPMSNRVKDSEHTKKEARAQPLLTDQTGSTAGSRGVEENARNERV